MAEATDPPAPNPGTPDPEVRARAKRRRFTADQKLRILGEADQCKHTGGVGRLLRREGIYFSQLAAWRKAREQYGTDGLHYKNPGPAPRAVSPSDARIHELEKQNRKLEKQLRDAEIIIEIQKKVAVMMEELKKKYRGPGSTNS